MTTTAPLRGMDGRGKPKAALFFCPSLSRKNCATLRGTCGREAVRARAQASRSFSQPSTALRQEPCAMSLASEAIQTSSPNISAPFGIRLTFTQGFLAGQLSVVVIALIAIRYIIFEDSRSGSKSSSRVKASAHSERKRKERKSNSGKEGLGAGGISIANVMADIMTKVRYEIDSHAGEPVDWLNVIMAQALAGYREDILAGGWSAEKRADEAQKTAREWMEDILNAKTVGRGMSFLVRASCAPAGAR